MNPSKRLWIVLALVALASVPAVADSGDKAGWSVATDPRRRAFLVWTPEQDGPRILMLGCLRDAETFTTMSDAVGPHDEIARAQLALSHGQARFEVAGTVTHYPHAGRSSFISDLDVDQSGLEALGRSLLPVLESQGQITLRITTSDKAGASISRQIPTAGLAQPLGRFRDICFK